MHFASPQTNMRSPDHPSEADRLAFLSRIDILDSESEQLYEDFVNLAAAICNVPVALVSLVAEDRQWFKAKYGLKVEQTSRESSFCSHAILDSKPTIVEDATKDHRFIDNELVVGDFHLRFYAGFPVNVEGIPLGTLCVIDFEPRVVTESQIAALTTLARQLSSCFDSRMAKKRHEESTEKLLRAQSRKLIHAIL